MQFFAFMQAITNVISALFISILQSDYHKVINVLSSVDQR